MNISAKDVSLMLSGGNSADLALASQACEVLKNIISPRAVYCRCELRGRMLGEETMLEGDDIMKHLEGCDAVWVLAATVGDAVDKETERLKADNLALAQAVDMGAALAVEALCDEKQTEIAEIVGKKGKVLTPRFSCGYGDFPLSVQPKLLSIADAYRRAGICVGSDYVMHPFKSVTALMGECDDFSGVPFDCKRCKYVSVCAHKLCARKAKS